VPDEPRALDEAEMAAAIQRDRAERWAELIRVKEEEIRPPFTRDIVHDAVRYFGSNHRPRLPYAHRDDEYSEILVAEDCYDCYHLYDGDKGLYEPEPQTWRENIEREVGLTPEEFMAVHSLEEEDLDMPVPREYLVRRKPYDTSPYRSAYLILVDGWPHGTNLPIGCLDLVREPPGHEETYRVIPKVALTFVQILLDSLKEGVKIVLE